MKNNSQLKSVMAADLKVGDKVLVYGRVTTVDEAAIAVIKASNRAFDIMRANPRMAEDEFVSIHSGNARG